MIFILLCLGCVTISFNVGAIAAVIPTMSQDLGICEFSVAKAIPVYMIPYGLGALLYPYFVKRMTYRKILTISMGLYALASFLSGWTNSLGILLLGRLLAALTGAGIAPLGLILIGKMFEKELRGRLVGLFFSTSFLASFVGISLSGFAPWRWQFFIPSVLALLTAVAIMFLTKQTLDFKEARAVDYSKILYNKPIRNVFIFILAVSLLYHGINGWLGIYFSRLYHLNQMMISLLFVVIAVGGMAGQNIGGYLADKKGRQKACYLGLLLLAVASMLLSGIFPMVLVVIICFVFSIGWTVGHNGISTVLTDFPDEYRAEIASLNSALRFLSGGIGFSLSGLFVSKSFQLTFFGIGIMMLALSFMVKKVIPETLIES